MDDRLHFVDVRLAIAVARPDAPNNTLFAVNNDMGLPSRTLRIGQGSFDLANELFCDITGASPGTWTLIRQVGIFDGLSPGTVVILYAAFIAEATPPPPGASWSWKTMDDLKSREDATVAYHLFGHACGFYRT